MDPSGEGVKLQRYHKDQKAKQGKRVVVHNRDFLSYLSYHSAVRVELAVLQVVLHNAVQNGLNPLPSVFANDVQGVREQFFKSRRSY